MKRPIENYPAATPPAQANKPCQSWPGLFFRQRADFSFEWSTSDMENFLGSTAATVKGASEQFWAIIHPADIAEFRKQIDVCKSSGQWISHGYRVCPSKTGAMAYISESRHSLLDKDGQVSGYEGFWIDVTRQTVAERRLVLAAWKETLADLTPGLAHDFNNFLTGILTMSEAYLAQIDATHGFHEGLSLIKQKAQEASQLIQRITRLSQEKTGSRDYQDVNAIVGEVVNILDKVIPKRIEVSSKVSVGSLPVYVDGVEFRRALLGLALSGVNTITGQGKLHFQTSRHDVAPVLSKLEGVFPRCPAIGLNLTTSSHSLRAEQVSSGFHPGVPQNSPSDPLDLSIHSVRLFAEQSSGAISFETAPGPRTIFRLWLPQSNFTEA